ncbi:MAG: hypothetical protein Q8O41_04615 [Candidatus Methanoperedens sp.]|nr:hypothetical protein [Candidatus Methanoperedens sp.]
MLRKLLRIPHNIEQLRDYLNYRLIIIEDNIVVDDVKETHEVRFYFPQEIAHYLEDKGFEVLKICPFLDMNGKVDENIWNIAVIAKAVCMRRRMI